MLYLNCAATLPKTGSKVDWKLAGTSATSYTLSSTTLTVMPVEKSTKVADAKLSVVAAASGNTASSTTVNVKCPAAGTAWV